MKSRKNRFFDVLYELHNHHQQLYRRLNNEDEEDEVKKPFKNKLE